jgi:hypothetical protein
VGISEAFTAAEQAEVIAAADEWTEATCGAIQLDLRIGTSTGQHAIVPNPRLSDGEVGDTKVPHDGFRDNVVIQLKTPYLEGARLRQVAMHELGHGFGIVGHFGSGLMRGYGMAGEHPCIAKADAGAVCDIVGCPDGFRGTCDDSACSRR